MIQHVVMLRLKPEADPTELSAVFEGLSALVGKIEGLERFVSGPNIDVEGKSPDFAQGFVCSFTDRAALDRYAQDRRHQELGARLVALCENGAAGIMVYDIDARIFSA